MRFFLIGCISIVALSLAGCGGTTTVTRTSAKVPEQIRTAAFSPQAGNSAEVTGYISDALASKGVATGTSAAIQGHKSSNVDTVVSYVDVWRWDIVTYLKSIAISLYNAKTGELLVTGRWTDSLLHTYFRGDSVSRDLINQMFEKLELTQGPINTVTNSSSMADTIAVSPVTIRETPSPSSTKPKPVPISRNEYAAREQARGLQCNAQGILGIEGAGTPREEIQFDCGGGKKVTIICRSGAGCS